MMDVQPLFADRRAAGRQLAAALRDYLGQEPVVLALPRGGVPVGFEVAAELVAPLDLLFVRKIGAPGHKELGLGALVDGADPQVVVNPEVLEAVQPPEGYVEEQVKRELREIDRRRRVYVGEREPLDVRGRTILLVDDGVATGGTMSAALQGLAKAQASRVVLGLPVGPPDVVARLAEEADEVVCLATPEPFFAVGIWYRDFTQTSDEEVIRLLAQERRASADRAAGEAPAAEAGR
jgi:putative phosphoribosyl transferase